MAYNVPATGTLDGVNSSVFATYGYRTNRNAGARHSQPGSVQARIEVTQIWKTRREPEKIDFVDWLAMQPANLLDAEFVCLGHAVQIWPVVYDRNFMKLRLRQGMRGERAEAIYPAGDDFLQVRGQSRIEFQQERCECWQKLNQARRGIALQLGNQRATAFKSLITDALGEPNQDRIRTIEAPLHSGAMLIDRPARSSRPASLPSAHLQSRQSWT